MLAFLLKEFPSSDAVPKAALLAFLQQEYEVSLSAFTRVVHTSRAPATLRLTQGLLLLPVHCRTWMAASTCRTSSRCTSCPPPAPHTEVGHCVGHECAHLQQAVGVWAAKGALAMPIISFHFQACHNACDCSSPLRHMHCITCVTQGKAWTSTPLRIRCKLQHTKPPHLRCVAGAHTLQRPCCPPLRW